MQTLALDDVYNHNKPIATKMGPIRHKFESLLQRLGVLNLTERDRIMAFNDYLKDLHLDPKKSYGNMLDVGAAEGGFALIAAKTKSFPDTTIKSIDYDDVQVQAGKKRGVDIETMNATELKYPDATFDTVISHASMPHCLLAFDFRSDKVNDDPKGNTKVSTWLSESIRVLKEGGELRFRCPAPNTDDYRGDMIRKVIDEFQPKIFEYTEGPKNPNTEKKYQFTMKDANGNTISQNKESITYIIKKTPIK